MIPICSVVTGCLLHSSCVYCGPFWQGQTLALCVAAWLSAPWNKKFAKHPMKVAMLAEDNDLSSSKRSLREGFLSNVLNPKTAIFYLAFLPQFIDLNHSPIAQSFTMASIHFLIAMVWQCSLAFTINSAKKLFKSSAMMNWMEGVTGVVLIALGAKLLLSDDKL